jgi:CheY-like chemotaxis protein
MAKEADVVVLVLDDDELVRSVVVRMLELKGYTILQANEPQNALALLRSPQRIDLLITDVRMPGSINGEQAVKVARNIRPGLRVLYMTGYAGDLSQGWIEDLDTQILLKPFRLNDFIRKVASMLPEPTEAD